MNYGAGAACVAGIGAGALPLTGFSVGWAIFFGIMTLLVGVAIFRISRRTEDALGAAPDTPKSFG